MSADGDERLIVGEGVPDAHWLCAPELAAVPEMGVERLMAGVARLVVLSPHPDDEVLGVGGLIASARCMGRPVQVLAATDGEACYPGEARWSPAELARVRRDELRQALDVLGDGIGIEHLRFPDGGLQAAQSALQARIAQCLRRGDLLLVPWRHDGHPDHEAAAQAGLAAALDAGCRCLEYPIWGWHWAAPETGRMPLARAMRLSMPPSLQARKREAIDAFASQLGTGTFDVEAPILPPWARVRFERSFEVLFA